MPKHDVFLLLQQIKKKQKVDLSIFITALLSDNQTVIVPDFGAFVLVYKPAVIREKEILPPGKEVRFFHQVKNNDGMLAMHIARSKKVSYDDAFKKIERAVTKILYQLDKGETVIFGDLGEFSYNENHEITFISYHKNQFVQGAGFEPLSFEDLNEQEETQIENEPEVMAKPAIEIVNEVQPEEPPVSVLHEEPVGKPIITEPNSAKTTVVEPKTEVAELKKETKKSRTWLWIFLLVIAIFVVSFLIFENMKKTPKDTPSVEIKTELIQPEVINPGAIQPTDTVAVEVSQTQSSISTQKYFLVGGSFKSEENALKFIAQLKNKGIEGSLLGQKGKIFLVGIASYNTEEEAFTELNRRMHENPDWKLWVYKK
jgi:nucleoid DNA-binding protein/cell division protein FtsN